MKKTLVGVVTIVTILFMMLATSVNAASLSVDKTEISKGDIITLTIKTDVEVGSMGFEINFDPSKFEYVEGSLDTDLSTMKQTNVKENRLIVSAFDTGAKTDTLKVQFKALENGENIEFTISNTEFTVDLKPIEETVANPTLNVTVEDSVVEPDEPTTPENPSVNPDEPTTDEPTTPENPSVNPDEPTTDEPTTPEKPSVNPDESTTDEPTTPEKPSVNPDESTTDEPTTPENPNAEPESPSTNQNDSDYVDNQGNQITKLPQTGSIVPSIVVAVIALAIVSLIVVRVIKNRK